MNHQDRLHLQDLEREKREKEERMDQLKKELATLDKDIAALRDKDLAVRDAWWMQLYCQQNWPTLAREMQQAGEEDEEEGAVEDERDWEDHQQRGELIEEEMAYVMARIQAREQERKQARSS